MLSFPDSTISLSPCSLWQSPRFGRFAPCQLAPFGGKGLPAAARGDLQMAGRDEGMVQFVLSNKGMGVSVARNFTQNEPPDKPILCLMKRTIRAVISEPRF